MDALSGVNYNRPQHPLPQEITALGQDGTICKYCGVSYLIHNEIKRMEDKMLAMEKELEHYKGSMEREKLANENVEKLRRDLLESEHSVKTLSDEKEHLVRKMGNIENTANLEKVRLKDQLLICQKNAVVVNENLQQLKTNFKELKTASTKLPAIITSDIMTMEELTACKRDRDTSRQESQRKARLLEEEKSNLQQSLNALASQLTHSKAQHTHLLEKSEKLQAELNKKDSVYSALQEKLDIAVKNRDDLLRKTDSLSRDISARVSEVQRLQEENTSMKRDTASLEMKLQNREAEFHNNTTDIDKLSTALAELKLERDKLLNGHQAQRDQLMDMHRTKLNSVRSELTKSLEECRQKHFTEMNALEDRLKEDFKLEMRIEQEKHRKLISHYDEQMRLINEKKQTDIDAALISNQKNIKEIMVKYEATQRQVAQLKSSHTKEIKELELTTQSLKDKLANAETVNSETAATLEGKLRAAEQRIWEQNEAVVNYKKANAELNNQVHSLQETVQRECEERFELTDALSEAKRQLLILKQPAQGYVGISSNASHKTPPPLPTGKRAKATK